LRGPSCRLAEALRDAEIANFAAEGWQGNKDVGGFQVSVKHPLRVQKLHT
jgi:hypothetical protein